MAHECIIEQQRDPFAYGEIYMVRCRCHMDAWMTWAPGDDLFECPKGTLLTVKVRDDERDA